MTHEDHVKIARAIRALKDAPATAAAMHALTGLHSLLPPAGSREARAVWHEIGSPDREDVDSDEARARSDAYDRGFRAGKEAQGPA